MFNAFVVFNLRKKKKKKKNISEKNNPDRIPRQTFGLKAESTLHRITNNPSSAQPGEIIRINIPQLSEDTVIIPGSVYLNFNLSITGHTNNRFVNNLGRNLIKELKVSYAGETLSIIQRYDLFKTYEDLFIDSDLRETGLLKFGISSESIRKLRANSGDKPSSPNAGELAISNVHGTDYKILLDHPILNDHGVLYPRGLRNSIMFELTLANVGDIVVYSDTTKIPNFSLSNIELEYSSALSRELANRAKSSYQIGKSFLYEQISLEKTFTINKATDGLINNQINLPRKSMSGILIFFREDTPGLIDSQKFVNPNLISVNILINGMPNRLFSKGMKSTDFWESILKRYNHNLSQKDFYAANKFALWIDLRTFPSNDIHGGGLKIDSTAGGIQLILKRETGGSGNITCYLFVVSDAVFDVIHSDIRSIMY